MNFIFYFNRLRISKKLVLFGQEVVNKQTGKKAMKSIPPQIKLSISPRKNNSSQSLSESIDLVNIGTWKDQLSFGVKDRKSLKGPQVKTITTNPSDIIRHFIDQIIEEYYGDKK